MNAPARNTHARAALLMLSSTVAFGLMAVCIRLASKTQHTLEVAFFRNGVQVAEDYAYNLVYPQASADEPRIKAFREWILGEMALG